jgi:hypothetical protein
MARCEPRPESRWDFSRISRGKRLTTESREDTEDCINAVFRVLCALCGFKLLALRNELVGRSNGSLS